MNNLEKSNQESTKRGRAFKNALSLETLDQALAAEIYIPVLLVLNHNEVTTTRHGAAPQESILTMQLTPNALVFSSLEKKSRGLKKTIALPENYQINISLLKRPALGLWIPGVEIYLLLKIKNDKHEYKLLSSDFPKLPALLATLDTQKISYTIPDFYHAIFKEKDDGKLERLILDDNRIDAKLLSEMPPVG